MFQVKPIGYIKTNYLKDPPCQPDGQEKGHYLLINKSYQTALKGLDDFKFIYVIFYLDKVENEEVELILEKKKQEVGLFATRTPRRPNPIALSIVKILKITGNKVYISGIDALDHSPILDIKPYIRKLDHKEEANDGWAEPHQSNKDIILLYTDGACSGNPGPGGYAALIMNGDNKVEIAGYQRDTTNNRMELLAVIEGLKEIEAQSKVRLISDSSYVLQGLSEWMAGWERNGWKTVNNKEVKNRDLWQQLAHLINHYNLEYVKVKGHSGDIYNERVDSLAREQIEKNKGD